MLFDDDLDVTGQLCPIPVLKARKRLKAMMPGSVLRIVSDDPLAAIDVPNFCREEGHDLLGTAPCGTAAAFFVRKASTR
ncbi:MAG: sulfurtransferase TusA family protein [Pseudomonadota bacterium]